MKTILILAATVALCSTPASADTLKPNYPVCISADLLGQMYTAMLNRDMASMDYLFDHGCFESKPGVQVSVIGQSDGAARLRIYAGKDAVEAWASIGAVSPSVSQ